MKSLGVPYFDLWRVGNGCPDLVAWSASRQEWLLLEVKNPRTRYGRKGFSSMQKAWIAKWRGSRVHIVTTIEEALAVVCPCEADVKRGVEEGGGE